MALQNEVAPTALQRTIMHVARMGPRNALASLSAFCSLGPWQGLHAYKSCWQPCSLRGHSSVLAWLRRCVHGIRQPGAAGAPKTFNAPRHARCWHQSNMHIHTIINTVIHICTSCHLRVHRTHHASSAATNQRRRPYVHVCPAPQTLERSYLLRLDNQVVERPQHMLMRVAVGIHKDDIEAAISTYHGMSERWFTHASPTLFNAGTPRPQLSSCFLIMMKGGESGGREGAVCACVCVCVCVCVLCVQAFLCVPGQSLSGSGLCGCGTLGINARALAVGPVHGTLTVHAPPPHAMARPCRLDRRHL